MNNNLGVRVGSGEVFNAVSQLRDFLVNPGQHLEVEVIVVNDSVIPRKK